MNHIIFSMIEIPCMMLLEYFYHERLTSSDSFFENRMIAINNLFTLIFVFSLAMMSFDYLMGQVTFQESDHGDMDGKLSVIELMNIMCAFLLLVASSIRIWVNSVEKTKFGEQYSGSNHRLAHHDHYSKL